MKNKTLSTIALLYFVTTQTTFAQWQATTGPAQPNVVSVCVSGTNMFAAAGTAVSYSSNNGDNWTLVSNGLAGTIYTLANKGTDIFAGAAAGKVFQTSNNGTNWSNTSTGLPAYNITFLTVSGGDIYAGTFGVYKSTNNGILWSKISNTWNAFVTTVAVSGDTILASTPSAGIYMTVDGGTIWSTINTGLPTNVDAVIIHGTTFIAGTHSGIYISTNGGTNWTATNVTDTVASFAVIGDYIFAGSSSGGGVYLSINGGTSWTAINAGLGNTTVYSLAIGNSYVFAGTTGFVWRRLLSEVLPLTVTTSANPTAGGTTTGDGSYSPNSSVTVTATPNTGYTFSNWTENGNVVSSNSSYTFTITANRNLVANFTPVVGNLSVTTSSNPTAGGTTTGDGSYAPNSSVTVTATANTGYTFSNWTESGNIVSSNSSYTFTITANRNLVANFTAIVGNFTVTTSSNPTSGGTTTGDGSYAPNSSVTVTATANTGYNFSNWSESGNIVSSSGSYTFTITANRNLVAEFVQTTSISEVANTSVSIYPNPSDGKLSVSTYTECNLRVYNSVGQLILSRQLSTGDTVLNIQDKGVMLFVFERGGQRTIRKQLIME